MTTKKNTGRVGDLTNIYHTECNTYQLRIKINDKSVSKTFKDLNNAIKYRDACIKNSNKKLIARRVPTRRVRPAEGLSNTIDGLSLCVRDSLLFPLLSLSIFTNLFIFYNRL